MSHILVQPEISVLRQTDDVIQDVVGRFQEAVRQDPESFLTVIRRLGGASIGFTDIYPTDFAPTESEQAADTLVNHLFTAEYDQKAEFDEATEDALADSQLIQNKIYNSRRLKTIDSHEGAMKVVRYPNPRSNEARDAVRWARLYLFASRMISYEQATLLASAEQLPSTG